MKKFFAGQEIYIEGEEKKVEVLQSKPCKMSALSTKNDGYEYYVRNNEGKRYWITQDVICEEENEAVENELTLEKAKTLKCGTILNHSNAKPNADGTPARFKVTSVKTWKRDAGRIEIRVQRGMYEHYTWTEADFDFATITIQK